MNRNVTVERWAILACVMSCMFLSGCGPDAQDLGQAALAGSLLVWASCYPLPLLYRRVMRRAFEPDVQTLALHMITGLVLGGLTLLSLDAIPNFEMDLIPIVCGLAACSMWTYVQLAWLIWCYRDETRRVSHVVTLVFLVMYVAPALVAALELEFVDEKMMEEILLAIWLFPGLYGIPVLVMMVICLAFAIRGRKETTRDDSEHTARTAQVFD